MSKRIEGFFKNLTFDYKSIDDETRIIEGYASTKDLDRVSDIVEPTAFKKAIKNFLSKNGILLFNHSYNAPIGKILKAKIDDTGLYVKAEIAKGTEKAEEVWKLIKQGVLKTFSFGFIPKSVEYKEEDDKEIRVVKDLDLLEISVVSVPANPNAIFVVAEGKAIDVVFTDKKAASGDTSLPLADMNRPWDKQRAVTSVRKWASSDGSGEKDKINWSKYKKAFFWYNEKDPENFGSYKLPFAEVIDGKLYAVPRGIMAAAAAIQGARGGVNIPADDIPKVKARIAKYYKKMGKTPPWEKGYFDTEEIVQLIDDYIMSFQEKLFNYTKDYIDKELEIINEGLHKHLEDEVEKILTKNKKQIKSKSENVNTNKLDEDGFYQELKAALSELLEVIKK